MGGGGGTSKNLPKVCLSAVMSHRYLCTQERQKHCKVWEKSCFIFLYSQCKTCLKLKFFKTFLRMWSKVFRILHIRAFFYNCTALYSYSCCYSMLLNGLYFKAKPTPEAGWQGGVRGGGSNPIQTNFHTLTTPHHRFHYVLRPPRFSIFTPAKQKLVHQLSFLTCFPDNMNCKNTC